MAKRGGKRRDPARERFWRRTIRQQEHSGLTVPDFCRREGLKDWTFRWWRLELTRRDRQTAEAAQRSAAREPTESGPVARFLPVRVIDQEAGPPQPSPPIEIVLPTGPTIRVPAGCNARTLGDVLDLLGRHRC
jgi:hypothetical protein